MPATIRFTGGSAERAQIDTMTVGGTVEVGDIFKVTIANKTASVVATSTVLADVAEEIATALQALDSSAYPEFAEITFQSNGATVTAEANTAGKPFTLSVSTTETGGGAADAQTFTSTTTTSNLSRNSAGLAANYSGNALPVTGDTLVFDIDSPDCLYDLEALSAITLAELRILSESVQIGLADVTSGNYPEYRPKFLKLGATAVLVETGANLVNLDLGAVDTTVLVKRTGNSSQPHRKSLCIKGGTASSVIDILRGSVGLGMLAGETTNFPVLRIGFIDNVDGDADVYCGPDCSLTTVTKNGGQLVTNKAVTTGTNRAGVWTIQAGAVSTLITEGTGNTVYNSTGTLTTPTVSQKGILDFGKDPRPKTITNPCEVYGPDASVLDPSNVVNVGGSFVFDLNQDAGLANIKIGSNRRVTIGTVA
jgi:hypothetical protein